MAKRIVVLAGIGMLALALVGCKRQEQAPFPSESVTPTETARIPTPSPSVTPSPSPSPTTGLAAVDPPPRLDTAALRERKDPDRVLRFYVNALQAGQWASAARAWGSESGVTAAMLRAAYDRQAKPRFEVGRATVEGGAGSLFYEAPVVLRFGGPTAPPERGTLLLRRVNDVDGATPEQLRWHIEKSTIGMGQ